MENIPLANNVSLAQNDYFGGANNDDNDDDGNNGNNNENKTITGTTLIKYQMLMMVVLNHMMTLTMVTIPRITMKIINTQKMRNMMVILVL